MLDKMYEILLGVLGYKLVSMDNSFILSRSLETRRFVIWTTLPLLRKYSECDDASVAKFNWFILMGRDNNVGI